MSGRVLKDESELFEKNNVIEVMFLFYKSVIDIVLWDDFDIFVGFKFGDDILCYSIFVEDIIFILIEGIIIFDFKGNKSDFLELLINGLEILVFFEFDKVKMLDSNFDLFIGLDNMVKKLFSLIS